VIDSNSNLTPEKLLTVFQ